MAWNYSLSAECGPDRSRATALAKHFEGLSFQLVTGKASVCSATVGLDDEHDWWVDIFPDSITQSNGSSLTDAIEVSEVGFRLYKRLRSAPQFRFALFGCEVQQFRLHSQLLDSVAVYGDGHKEFDRHPAFDGLVLSDEIWEELEQPIAFVRFADGYRWRLYGGKEHAVVLDDAHYGRLLRGLRNELYPEPGPSD
jgi:hypothetical protein